MDNVNNAVISYVIERVRKGFEFEVESSIWHGVLEVMPHTIAGAFGWGLESGHYIVIGGVVVVCVGVLVVRRRKGVRA